GAKNDDPFLRPGKLGDDIANRDLTGRGFGNEGVFLDRIVLQLAVEVFACLLLPRTAVPSWPDGDNVFDILPRACGIDLHRRSGGVEEFRFLSLLCRRRWRRTGHGGGVLAVTAENKCEKHDEQPIPATLIRSQVCSPGENSKFGQT